MKRPWKRRVAISSEFEPSEERKKLYATYWAEAQTRLRLSSDSFDKAILTYSSSGLAVSLAFLKDIVPIKTALYPIMLYVSWGCFVISTGLTVLSFLASYKSQEIALDHAGKYYMEGREEFLGKETWHSCAIVWLNRCAGAAFISALVATSVFVGINLSRESDMTKRTYAQDGMPPALMQKVTGEQLNKGLPAASIPKAPPAQKPQATSVPASNPTKPNGS
ncbi:hypothetical protein [Janthinobacterium lividum]